MTSEFLSAGFVQLYGSPLSGKTDTLSRLCGLLHYSYERVVVVEHNPIRRIALPFDANPQHFLFSEGDSLDALADAALDKHKSLLLIDDYDAYGTSVMERRNNLPKVNRLQSRYDKVVVTSASIFNTPTTGRVANFKLAYAHDNGDEYIQISRKGQQTSIEAFMLTLSRKLKLRHLAS